MDLAVLDAAVHFYCQKGLAESTHKTYRAGVQRFMQFCASMQISNPFPVSELLLCRFVAFLARSGLAPSTVKTYLAAVRHTQVVRGLPEPRQESRLPRLQLVQRGMQKTRAEAGRTQTDTRLPITLPVLQLLHRVWSGESGGGDGNMLWAAAAMCFFGFFRSGEITIPNLTSFDQRHHLSWGDVAVDDTSNPSIIKVHLKRSKCDQLQRGVDVCLGRVGGDLCPVAAVMLYVSRRGPVPGCFFLFGDGSPLTKARFVGRIREALRVAGVPAEGYSGHSFRIGAATTAALAGVEDSAIRMLGRWNSDAFRSYVHTPRDRLAGYSAVMGGVRLQ